MAIANFIQTVRGRKNTEYEDGAIPLAASQYLRNDGGRFLVSDTAGHFSLAGTAATTLDAWAYTCYQSDHSGDSASSNTTPFVGSASAGVSVVSGTKNIHTEDDAAWLPSNTTLTAGNVGDQCDLIVTGSTTSTKQLIDPTITTNKVVQILDVDLTNQLALVYAIK